MATINELAAITRALNGVETGAQARLAVGAALKAIGATYPVLDRLSSAVARGPRRELDDARIALEAWFPKIPSGAVPFGKDFAKKRDLVERAYIVIAGIEGAADWEPTTSFGAILESSIHEGLANVGKAAGEVTGAAGRAAGSALGGIFSGLGVSGLVTIAIVVAIVVVLRRRVLGGLV